jgi:hypothetical protein
MYRLTYRNADGSAVYKGIDRKGSEMLTVKVDGSTFSHFVGGVCMDCATGGGLCDWPDCPNRGRVVSAAASAGSEFDLVVEVETSAEASAEAPVGAPLRAVRKALNALNGSSGPEP